jgi:hypothetical protein
MNSADLDTHKKKGGSIVPNVVFMSYLQSHCLHNYTQHSSYAPEPLYNKKSLQEKEKKQTTNGQFTNY